MSSQSTLVRREPYEDLEPPSYGIMDMIGPELGHGRLTESRINAHMQQEARRHGGGYRREEGDYEDTGEIFVGGKLPRRRRREHHRVGQLVVTPEHEGRWSFMPTCPISRPKYSLKFSVVKIFFS